MELYNLIFQAWKVLNLSVGHRRPEKIMFMVQKLLRQHTL